MRIFFLLLLLLSMAASYGQNKKKSTGKKSEFIALKIYHAANSRQLDTIEHYLQNALLPSLEKVGFSRIGVWKAIDNDTAQNKRLYVLIPFGELAKLEQLATITDQSIGDTTTARDYTKAAHNRSPYTRYETIILQAFEAMPNVMPSGIKGDKTEAVYELRSYESATEALHQNKVKMFNRGEVQLFERLGFNAVFYGRVIAGSKMPNLMYVTSFASKAERDAHWKTFSSDAEWKAMSGKLEYKNNVSHIDITFLRPTTYSKL